MVLPSRYPFPVTVEAADLACMRGGRPVFAGVSFRVAAGEMLALTGANGTGKSSLLRLLAGLIQPAAGAIRISGGGEGAGLHYLGHLDALKSVLTLAETMRFWAALHDVAPSVGAMQDAAAAVGLGHAWSLPVGVLSAGQRRRAGLARLILAPRPLWLLDEPGSALDADGDALLGRLVAEHLGAGGSVIAATHDPLPVAAHATLRFGGA